MNDIALYFTGAVLLVYLVREFFLQRKIKRLEQEALDATLLGDAALLAAKKKEVDRAKRRLERLKKLRDSRSNSSPSSDE